MTKQYIDKDALVAEIKSRIKCAINDVEFSAIESRVISKTLNLLLLFIDTIEVKEIDEPNVSDKGIAEEIIMILKQIENDYHIDHTKEIEWVKHQVKENKV